MSGDVYGSQVINATRHGDGSVGGDGIPAIIIDTDVGIDDVSSLIALANTPSCDIKAITLVDGNVGVSVGLSTVRNVLHLLKKEIPVFVGADGPLCRNFVKKEPWTGHGADGLGDFTATPTWFNIFSPILPSIPAAPSTDEHAALALIRLVNCSPLNSITVLALGPLTNIAIAITIDRKFLSKVKRLICMGGAINARGNASRVAEFNFHCDPEAVHIVLDSARSLASKGEPPIVHIVPWETTMKSAIDWTVFDNLVAHGGLLVELLKGYTKKYGDVARKIVASCQQKDVGIVEEYKIQANSFLMCDIYAAIIAIDTDAITAFQDWHVQVELAATISRGLVAYEWFGSSELPNARVILGVDRKKVEKLFEAAFS